MTNETRILAVVASLLLVGVVSPASAQRVDLTASVPFEFRVGDEVMPRDAYRISRAHEGSSALMLRSERKSVVFLVLQGRPYDNAVDPRLVFHRIGDQYFLREVQLLGRSALELRVSRGEREAMQRIASGAPAGVERVVIRAEK
jgi:hypothetical protein